MEDGPERQQDLEDPDGCYKIVSSRCYRADKPMTFQQYGAHGNHAS